MSGERRRGAALLTVSLLVHGLVLAAILAALPLVPTPPLMIDLTELGEPARLASVPARGGDDAPAPRAANRRAAPARGGATSEAPRIAPPPPTAPPLVAAAPPPRPVPAEPPAPPAVLAAPTITTPVPPAEAAPLATSSAPSVGDAAPSGTVGVGAGTSPSGIAQGSAGRGTEPGGVGAQSGSSLALARPGEGGGVPAEYGPYLTRFRQRVEAALVYPLSARRLGRSGRVELEVLLEPTGRVRRVEVAQSSANAALDEAALDAVRSIAPVPFPESLPRRPLLLRLPLVFELR